MADRRDPLGFDAYIGPQPGGGVDITADGRAASGVELVRNGMVARCLSDAISMVGAPGGVRAFGKDLRALVGGATTDDFGPALAQEMAIIFARDPRLDAGSILVAVTVGAAGAQYAYALQVTARTTTQQPIAMLLGVSAVSVDILAQQSAT